MTKCPYCDSERFDKEAELIRPPTTNSSGKLNQDAIWQNRCLDCGNLSFYDEETGKQYAVTE